MELPEIKQFTIRIYAIFINSQNELLVCDEYWAGIKLTKFPGGGLEFNEGAIDCLHREFMEEMGQEIEVLEHFYTCEFFQRAITSPERQLFTVYYTVRFKDDIRFKISTVPFDFPEWINGSISFRFIPISQLSPEEFGFQSDIHVAKMIKEKYDLS